MLPESAGILVDTSVWIKFFRFGHAGESLHLDSLLEARAVRTCAPVRTEVFSGAKTERERSRLKELFLAVPSLEFPADIWERVEETRFRLARKGHQASLIDLMIAVTAFFHETPLWTLDDDFKMIREAVALHLYSY